MILSPFYKIVSTHTLFISHIIHGICNAQKNCKGIGNGATRGGRWSIHTY